MDLLSTFPFFFSICIYYLIHCSFSPFTLSLSFIGSMPFSTSFAPQVLNPFSFSCFNNFLFFPSHFSLFCLYYTQQHTYTYSFCGGRRDANKNETWGLCRRPPADWGTPWEWWSAGSLSLPRRWTRRSGFASPPPLHPALPFLFLLLSCTGVYQQYTPRLLSISSCHYTEHEHTAALFDS